MRAIVLNEPGAPENLTFKELAQPSIEETEVLIKVKAIAINPVDLKTRKGQGVYGRIKTENPLILGWDVSGEIVETGKSVSKFKKGDQVFGMVNFPGHGKAYAEYVAAPQDHLAKKPDGITHEEAAAASLACLTAFQVLVHQAKIKPGEKVLVHAAAGGVGHFAVQLAKHYGAYVIGTASTANKEFLEELGLNEFIDYTQVDFCDFAKEVDVVLDPIGGENLNRSLITLKKGGRLVSIVGMSDEVKKQAEEKGVVPIPYLVQSNGSDMETIAELLKSGKIKAHISHKLEFKAIEVAHKQLATSKTRGKVVLTL